MVYCRQSLFLGYILSTGFCWSFFDNNGIDNKAGFEEFSGHQTSNLLKRKPMKKNEYVMIGVVVVVGSLVANYISSNWLAPKVTVKG
jgi:hypothetical protein